MVTRRTKRIAFRRITWFKYKSYITVDEPYPPGMAYVVRGLW